MELFKKSREVEIQQPEDISWVKEGYNKFEVFKKEPFKYDIKFTFYHWVIFRQIKFKNEWCGYAIPLHIDDMYNKYEAVNFTTGETRFFTEFEIDELVNTL